MTKERVSRSFSQASIRKYFPSYAVDTEVCRVLPVASKALRAMLQSQMIHPAIFSQEEWCVTFSIVVAHCLKDQFKLYNDLFTGDKFVQQYNRAKSLTLAKIQEVQKEASGDRRSKSKRRDGVATVDQSQVRGEDVGAGGPSSQVVVEVVRLVGESKIATAGPTDGQEDIAGLDSSLSPKSKPKAIANPTLPNSTIPSSFMVRATQLEPPTLPHWAGAKAGSTKTPPIVANNLPPSPARAQPASSSSQAPVFGRPTAQKFADRVPVEVRRVGLWSTHPTMVHQCHQCLLNSRRNTCSSSS